MEAYERYGRALIRRAARVVGNPDDARDLVQALFVDLYQRDDVPLDLPYLYRAVTNRCLTFLRDESNRARLLERNAAALAPSARTRCDDRAIGLDLLGKLVRELDEAETEVLTYHFLDDMTQDEIATLLGLSRKTVGKRLERVRHAVRRLAQVEAGGPPDPGGSEP
ncbi:MAG: sigma-70 family RNA polymerase sigma factor [Polyangiaceae bacterium]|jgi:RNA polymerase sigma-70 factor (ECF subfamily)